MNLPKLKVGRGRDSVVVAREKMIVASMRSGTKTIKDLAAEANVSTTLAKAAINAAGYRMRLVHDAEFAQLTIDGGRNRP